jgi:hypothetical protein
VLKLGKRTDLPAFVSFCDWDFAGDRTGPMKTFRSTSGSCSYYRGALVLWSAKLQTLTALSTWEAESCSIFDKVKIIESAGFIDEISRIHGEESSVHMLFNDNQAAIQIWQNELPTKKSRHFSLRLAYIKEHIDNISFVPTDYNKADMQTKPLTSKHYKLLFYTKPFDGRLFQQWVNRRKKNPEHAISTEDTPTAKVARVWGRLKHVDFNYKVKTIYTSSTITGYKRHKLPLVDVTENLKSVVFYNNLNQLNKPEGRHW